VREAADAERIERLPRELGRVVRRARGCISPAGRSRCNLDVFDFDPCSQALSKLERGFDLDLQDVRSMVDRGQVEPIKLLELLSAIEGDL
jgi:hypothetical protein